MQRVVRERVRGRRDPCGTPRRDFMSVLRLVQEKHSERETGLAGGPWRQAAPLYTCMEHTGMGRGEEGRGKERRR